MKYIDIDKFKVYLDETIIFCETAEEDCINDCEYARAIEYSAYVDILLDLLAMIELDDSCDWIAEVDK